MQNLTHPYNTQITQKYQVPHTERRGKSEKVLREQNLTNSLFILSTITIASLIIRILVLSAHERANMFEQEHVDLFYFGLDKHLDLFYLGLDEHVDLFYLGLDKHQRIHWCSKNHVYLKRRVLI